MLLKSLFKIVGNLSDAEIFLFTCAVTKIKQVRLKLYVVLGSLTASCFLESLIVIECSVFEVSELGSQESFPY